MTEDGVDLIVGAVSEERNGEHGDHYHVSDSKYLKPISFKVYLEGQPVTMEIDSGFCSVKDTPFRLRTHTGGSRMWFCYVTMQYQGQSKELPVYVTKVRGHLFGREWLESLQLDWPLLQVETSATIPVF